MRNLAVLTIVFMSLVGVSKADPLVVGSTFDVFLVDYDNVNKYANFGDWTLTVGGGSVPFSFDGATGTISMTETALGGNQDQIVIHVLADGGTQDVFPTTANGGLGYFSAGFYDPFDLTTPSQLNSAVFNESGTSTVYGPFDGSIYNTQTDPWSGYAIGDQLAIGFNNSQGQGVDDLTLTLTATELPPAQTPEPGTLTLLGTGLAGLIGVGRRRLQD